MSLSEDAQSAARQWAWVIDEELKSVLPEHRDAVLKWLIDALIELRAAPTSG